MRYIPTYDLYYQPIAEVLKNYRKEVKNAPHDTLKICVERNKGYNYCFSIDIFKDGIKLVNKYPVIERLIKTVLWVAGGYKIYVCGSDYISPPR